MCCNRFFWLALVAVFLVACKGEKGLERLEGSETQPPSFGTLKIGELTAVEGVYYEHQLLAPTDVENIIFVAINLPRWLTLDSKTGVLSGTPTAQDVTAFAPINIVAKASTIDDSVSVKTMDIAKDFIVVLHAAALDDNQKIDYYHKPFDGHDREYRNDLVEGELKGEVQFIQTHAVAPSSQYNYVVNADEQIKSQYIPNIIALREALLLFLPDVEKEPVTLHARVSSPGKPTLHLAMAHPNDLPLVDKPAVNQLHYSQRAWSVILPWDYINTGLHIEFIVDKDAPNKIFGVLPSEVIDVDLATQLELQFVRLGMLMDPVELNSNHFMLDDPILAATDYFQTIPTSRLVVGAYGAVMLPSTIVNQGGRARVYDIYSEDPQDHSSDSADAGVYSGDMRENVGKSQVSIGINLANAGVTSWDMNQNYPHATKMITNHHARGLYKCTGRESCPESGYFEVEHGLSGGNGIGTLISSSGNEASHEWGHAYGLGHYPGNQLTVDGRWARHNAKSGWGYIAHRHRLRSNVFQIAETETVQWNTEGITQETVPAGGFLYSRDAMSGAGGDTATPFSRYSFYSSYTARIIQQNLNQFNIADPEFVTGYKKWNVLAGEYQEAEGVKFDGRPAPIPKEVGVPVATILGGYDPERHGYQEGERRAVIYPVFYGNYGKVFDLSAPNHNDGQDHCWVEVVGTSGEIHSIEVLAYRRHHGSINQFHFNLPASFQPTSAALYCQIAGQQKEQLASTVFDNKSPELPPVAIVGQEAGAQQLMAREMQEINEGIMSLTPDLLSLPAELEQKISSYTRNVLEVELPPVAWEYLNEWFILQDSARGIDHVLRYGEAFGLSADEQAKRLVQHLQTNGLMHDADKGHLEGAYLSGKAGVWAAAKTAYIATEYNSEGRLPLIKNMDEAEQHPWLMDSQGKLHPVNRPQLCLTATNPVTLSNCDPKNVAQRWFYDEDTLALRANNGQCLDTHDGDNAYLALYNCTGGWNQQWEGVVVNKQPWLSFTQGKVVAKIIESLCL